MTAAVPSNGLTPLADPARRAAPLNASQVQMGQFRSPQKIIATYSPDEWEEFTEEWVRGLSGYTSVGRSGGAGDRGVDVAAWLTSDGFAGPWHCYQCKHYAKKLTPTDAHIEISKIIAGAIEGSWLLPTKYYFVAPLGVGPSLLRLLNGGDSIRDAFVSWIDTGGPAKAGLDFSAPLIADIRARATTIDWLIFKSLAISDVLEYHRSTQWYVPRFGGGIPSAPVQVALPPTPDPSELGFLEALFAMYKEERGSDFSTFDACNADPEISRHLLRQRERFFSAETLERHVRDYVPVGTFQLLQGEVLDGVVDTAERYYQRSRDRLDAVLERATSLEIVSNPLVQVCRIKDRQGICHQLAGKGEIRWVPETSSS